MTEVFPRRLKLSLAVRRSCTNAAKAKIGPCTKKEFTQAHNPKEQRVSVKPPARNLPIERILATDACPRRPAGRGLRPLAWLSIRLHASRRANFLCHSPRCGNLRRIATRREVSAQSPIRLALQLAFGRRGRVGRARAPLPRRADARSFPRALRPRRATRVEGGAARTNHRGHRALR